MEWVRRRFRATWVRVDRGSGIVVGSGMGSSWVVGDKGSSRVGGNDQVQITILSSVGRMDEVVVRAVAVEVAVEVEVGGGVVIVVVVVGRNECSRGIRKATRGPEGTTIVEGVVATLCSSTRLNVWWDAKPVWSGV